MISHKWKCIFIHITRTGGTSIEHWLQGKPQWQVKHNSQHITSSYARDREYSDYYNDYFKFAFVRNPYERVASELFMARLYNNAHLSLNLDNPEHSLMHVNENHYKRINCKGGTEINDYPENLKPNCIYQNILAAGVDKVYKFEEFSEAVKDISSILGKPLPNGGLTRKWSERVPSHEGPIKYPIKSLQDLRPKDIEVINDLYGSDFEEYGYERL